MTITNLQLKNFRNIDSTELSPSPLINLIYGDNGAGKTNTVEAIWLFTGAKSFRTARDADFLKFGEEHFVMSLDFTSGENESNNYKIKYDKDGKQAYKNDVKEASVRAFAGGFLASVFSPHHLTLVKGYPADRRRFIDTAVCQTYPMAIEYLTLYNEALRQKTALLKNPSGNVSTLDIWDCELAKYGTLISKYRQSYTDKLFTHASRLYEGISEGKEVLTLSYKSGISIDTTQPNAQIYDDYISELRNNRTFEIQARSAMYGCHKDDISIELDDRPARQFASQGQQKSCALALKLAESELLHELSGEPPVIILDDVMSELDARRQSFIYEKIKGRQVFITSCDRGAFEVDKEFYINAECGMRNAK
jgi:DNA replication and repair protein RecF